MLAPLIHLLLRQEHGPTFAIYRNWSRTFSKETYYSLQIGTRLQNCLKKCWLYSNESMIVIFWFSIEKEEPKNLFFIQSIRTHAHRYYHFAFLVNLDRQNRVSRASRQHCKWQIPVEIVLCWLDLPVPLDEVSAKHKGAFW